MLMPSMLAVAAMLCIGGLVSVPLNAQTRGPKVVKAQELRATGVLEWTGEAGKPSASRLIPVAVFTGEQYQDAGVYMARPEPMAVEGDTEYELLQAGIPKGRFDIFSAGNTQGSWYGYGVWKPLEEVKAPKLSVSKVMPEVVKDVDSDRPHLSKKGDKPDTGSSPQQTAGKDSPQARAGTEPHVSSTSDDPDRPKLRRRPKTESSGGDTPGEAVSGVEDTDPDRPKMHRGIPAAMREESKLTGTPPSLHQMVALSTTANDEPHSYVYQWADAADATKMQASMEKLAREALAGQRTPEPIGAAHSATPARTARRTTAHTAKSASPANAAASMTVDDFRAFELSYGGGATLVLSCRTAGEGNAAKYVTLIAQPDFYGSPRVIFQQVTDAGHLDVTPRMKLIDAADTDGDHRAELLFELRGRGERQFGIYRIVSGRVEQVFLTSELP
ncbi:MAG TPA: hypothetical protein VM554_08910 [Acidisarcina sp.]|nr:hypothetical protein [Acidisarcina sp.]